jgi:hypothetical protein
MQQKNNKIFIKTSCSRFSGGFQAAIAAPSVSCFFKQRLQKNKYPWPQKSTGPQLPKAGFKFYY